MLNAAFAQGIPITVTTMIMAATIQPSAIHRPPLTIHAMLSRRERTDILWYLTHAPRSECRYRNRRLPAPNEVAPALTRRGQPCNREHPCYGDRLPSLISPNECQAAM